MKRTNKKKAARYNNISIREMKRFTTKAIVALTNIINAMLRLRYFPEKWKYSDVIMLPN